MRDIKLSFAALAVAALMTASAHANRRQPTDEAQDVLMRSMEQGKQTPVVAILYQRAIGGHSAKMQVKVEQSKDGRTKLTVLQPLSMEGVTYVDDGRILSTYLPDLQHQIVQESPRRRQQDIRTRMALAQQNYVFRLEQPTTIAGRKAVLVVAQPKSQDMAVRRYYIDESTAFLLRMEKVGPNKEHIVQLDTKLIKFPKSLPKESFEFDMIRKPRTFNCPSPVRIASVDEVRPKLGFMAVVPKKLPYGFTVQEPQIAGSNDFRFAAIRLTDGLVNTTVYQWAGHRKDLPKGFKVEKVAKGVAFQVVGDVPEIAKQQILDLFVREANKNTRMLVEPAAPASALKGERRELLNMLLYSIQNAVVEQQTDHTGMCAFSRTAGL
jgi:outer membrane lipoprotein-sorting protein